MASTVLTTFFREELWKESGTRGWESCLLLRVLWELVNARWKWFVKFQREVRVLKRLLQGRLVVKFDD